MSEEQTKDLFTIATFIQVEEGKGRKIEQWTSETQTLFFIQFPTPVMMGEYPMMQDIPIPVQAETLDEAFANYDSTINALAKAAEEERNRPSLVTADGLKLT